MNLFRALICLISISCSSLAFAKEQPNFLVILCDDLGYGDLGCFGNSTIKTPHLDQLAAEGIRLTDCYSSSPLCSPARAGLLTGRTPSRTGIYSWIAGGNPMHLKRDEKSIATLLKQKGYQTCHVGKWHLNGKFNNPQQTQPNDHGFDHWFATQNNASPTHRDPNNFVRNGESVGQQKGFSCQLVANEAINWMDDNKNSDDPFFMFVCFHEPHEPIDSPDQLVKNYPDANKKGEALYYANVTNMDNAVGRLMKKLDDLEISEETLVVFTSDNGPETLNRYRSAWRSHGSPGPLRGMKLHVYDGGIRVPGIIRWSGKIAPKQISNQPVSGVDLLPTICELADVSLPTQKTLDGTSIVPLIDGKKVKRDKPLFWHYFGGTGNRQVALRDGDWKVVARWNGPANMPVGGSLKAGVVPALKESKLTHFELYNIAEDVAETTDLATAMPEKFKALSEEAQAMYREVITEGPYWFDD
ncbi:MAG: sulfatase, partial [Planctomicrobium sp.]|nr:sulfatase [Planctomicrobium sp.]